MPAGFGARTQLCLLWGQGEGFMYCCAECGRGSVLGCHD